VRQHVAHQLRAHALTGMKAVGRHNSCDSTHSC
jgi:hypothetical protein